MGVERRDVTGKALEANQRNDLVQGSWADSRADLAPEREVSAQRSPDAALSPAGRDATDGNAERATEASGKVERSMSRPEAILRGAAITGLVIFAPILEGGPVPHSPELHGRNVSGYSRDIRDYAPRLVRSSQEQGEAWLAVKEEQDRDRAIADVGRGSGAAEVTESRSQPPREVR
jgi:hypothetical protein